MARIVSLSLEMAVVVENTVVSPKRYRSAVIPLASILLECAVCDLLYLVWAPRCALPSVTDRPVPVRFFHFFCNFTQFRELS